MKQSYNNILPTQVYPTQMDNAQLYHQITASTGNVLFSPEMLQDVKTRPASKKLKSPALLTNKLEKVEAARQLENSTSPPKQRRGNDESLLYMLDADNISTINDNAIAAIDEKYANDGFELLRNADDFMYSPNTGINKLPVSNKMFQEHQFNSSQPTAYQTSNPLKQQIHFGKKPEPNTLKSAMKPLKGNMPIESNVLSTKLMSGADKISLAGTYENKRARIFNESYASDIDEPVRQPQPYVKSTLKELALTKPVQIKTSPQELQPQQHWKGSSAASGKFIFITRFSSCRDG